MAENKNLVSTANGTFDADSDSYKDYVEQTGDHGTPVGVASSDSPQSGSASAKPAESTNRQAGVTPTGTYYTRTPQGGVNYYDALNNPGKRVDMSDGSYLQADGNGNVFAYTKDYGVQRVQNEAPVVNISRVGHVDTSRIETNYAAQRDAAERQARQQVDYAVETGARDLERAQEDAAPKYQAMRDQIDIDEARAKDNQALYAEARGDRGGIGAAQYDSIMNTAAQNRVRVNQEQTKLATDTARAIADLRAQGEFQKADAILQLTQNYLSQLNQLEQWALSTNLSIDQFNIGIDQWLENFQMQAANITGEYKGMQTLSAQKWGYEQSEAQRQNLVNVASGLLDAGMESSVTDDMLKALGFSDAEIANGTARTYAKYVVGEKKKTDAQSRVATMLQAGAMLSEIPADVLKSAGFEDWELKAMLTPQAQSRVETDLALGMSLNDIPKELRDATGWTQKELESRQTAAQTAIQAAVAKGTNAAKGSGGSGAPETEKPRLTAAQASKAVLEDEIYTPQTLDAYEYWYGGLPGDLPEEALETRRDTAQANPGASNRMTSAEALRFVTGQDYYRLEDQMAALELLQQEGRITAKQVAEIRSALTRSNR